GELDARLLAFVREPIRGTALLVQVYEEDALVTFLKYGGETHRRRRLPYPTFVICDRDALHRPPWSIASCALPHTALRARETECSTAGNVANAGKAGKRFFAANGGNARVAINPEIAGKVGNASKARLAAIDGNGGFRPSAAATPVLPAKPAMLASPPSSGRA